MIMKKIGWDWKQTVWLSGKSYSITSFLANMSIAGEKKKKHQPRLPIRFHPLCSREPIENKQTDTARCVHIDAFSIRIVYDISYEKNLNDFLFWNFLIV